jgi:hypothetical protein
MITENILKQARQIWGDDRLSLEEIIIRLNVNVGDISRLARNKAETGKLDEIELKKELGNTIFSLIRWCDDLGYDVAECLQRAETAQQKYVQQRKITK